MQAVPASAHAQAYGCYECQEFEGALMVACHSPRSAAEAALAIQERLLGAEWPEALLALPAGAPVTGPSGALIFRCGPPRVLNGRCGWWLELA